MHAIRCFAENGVAGGVRMRPQVPRHGFAATALLLVALSVTGLGAPPAAEGIVGGHVVAKSSYPWHVVLVEECAGVLVLPSRVLTSANCINEAFLGPGDRLHIGGQRRRIAGIANHPRWVRQELAYADHCNLDVDCDFAGTLWGYYCTTDRVCSHDLALIGLDRTVRLPRPPRLASSRIGSRVTAIGTGSTDPESDDDDARLRAVSLDRISDVACARRYARAGRLRAFHAPTMLCAADTSAPRRAGFCFGDSGGPLLSLVRGHWRLVGIASWNSDCGLGGWPSVFTDTWEARSFIRAKRPTWLPSMTRAARLTGTPSVGQTLTCVPPPTSAPATSWIFTFLNATEDILQRGPSAAFAVREPDRDSQLSCRVEARNAGGVAVAKSSHLDIDK